MRDRTPSARSTTEAVQSEAGSLLRKKKRVREAIFEAAITLFAQQGFDQTTVEEVAQAAGVSRRSMFRYFPTKNDLLAQSVMNYEQILLDAIEACGPGASAVSLIRAGVFAGAEHTGSQHATRTVIEISVSSLSARQAQQSRMVDVADSLEKAFARSLRITQKNDSRPRLYAHLTLTILNVAIVSWFQGQHESIPAAAEQELFETMRAFSGQHPSDNPGAAAGTPPATAHVGAKRSRS